MRGTPLRDLGLAWLSPGRTELLRAIAAADGCDATTLARKLGRHQTNVTRELRALHQHGVLSVQYSAQRAIYRVIPGSTHALADQIRALS